MKIKSLEFNKKYQQNDMIRKLQVEIQEFNKKKVDYDDALKKDIILNILKRINV